MKKMSLIIATLSAAGLLTCTTGLVRYHIRNNDQEQSGNLVTGIVDEVFAYDVNRALQSHSELRIESQGGSASYGWISAQSILNKQSSIILEGDCFSACAEFLLPSAKTIKINRSVLIGLHGNDFIFNQIDIDLFGGRGYVDPERLMWLRSLYDKKNLNKNFYKEVMSRLDIRYADISNNLPHQIVIYSVVSMWFPTSDQLRNIWGLEFEGKICADDRSCWEKKIISMADGDEKFVVGDVLVSVSAIGEIRVEPWVPSIYTVQSRK